MNPETPLTPEQIATVTRKAEQEGYIHRDVVSVDQALSTMLGDPVPDETVSAWAGRVAVHGEGFPRMVARDLCRVLNVVLSPDHDQKAIIADGVRGEEVAAAEAKGLMK